MAKGARGSISGMAALLLAAGTALPALSQGTAILPVLPPTPVLNTSRYPQCREDFQKRATPLERATELNRCTDAIDRFYRETLLTFRQRMIAHQSKISRLYSAQVAGKAEIPAKSQQDFYQRMMQEHAASDPDGAHLGAYRDAEARYQQDRAYLQDRYCFTTGCGGYPAPSAKAVKQEKPGTAAPKAVSKSAGTGCKRARKRGSFVGGLLGGVAGQAAGLRGVESVIAAAFSGVLVGEIACQLTEKEQEKAAQATIEVTKKEEVGAVSSWQSPTRAGVSGSSTVTAINATPRGAKCLSITDVAIVDGLETRVQKQMCRGAGESAYKIVAA